MILPDHSKYVTRVSQDPINEIKCGSSCQRKRALESKLQSQVLISSSCGVQCHHRLVYTKKDRSVVIFSCEVEMIRDAAQWMGSWKQRTMAKKGLLR